MGFRQKLQYYLVHQQNMSNKQAKQLIAEGLVHVNKQAVSENVVIKEEDEIAVGQKVLRPRKNTILIKYHKPVGRVSSLNPKVKHSLHERFKDHLPLCIAGRLDKNSEGLLLLTNNGKWAQEITHPLYEKEKTYVVKVDKAIDAVFLENMRNGIEIMGQKTKPATCKPLDAFQFEIRLKEGKNRQIRRMCRKQGFRVLLLKRISVGPFQLGHLLPDDLEMLNFT